MPQGIAALLGITDYFPRVRSLDPGVFCRTCCSFGQNRPADLNG